MLKILFYDLKVQAASEEQVTKFSSPEDYKNILPTCLKEMINIK